MPDAHQVQAVPECAGNVIGAAILAQSAV